MRVCSMIVSSLPEMLIGRPVDQPDRLVFATTAVADGPRPPPRRRPSHRTPRRHDELRYRAAAGGHQALCELSPQLAERNRPGWLRGLVMAAEPLPRLLIVRG